MKPLVCVFRIIGNTAQNNNIYQSVCEHIQKNFTKSKWKVRDFTTIRIVLPLFVTYMTCHESFVVTEMFKNNIDPANRKRFQAKTFLW